jgi:peptidoglycan/LPS O-acetylase OafA/YrhL
MGNYGLVTAMVSTPNTKQRFYELDLFRFLAALFVLLHHYLFRGQVADGYSPVSFAPWLETLGQYATGFNFFFMTSGFVLLMNAFKKTPSQFIVSRAQRLYPALWVCCTITYLVSLLTQNPRFMVSPLDYLLNLTMFNGFIGVPFVDGAYWTMMISLKFNLLLLLVMLFKQTGRVHLLAWLWLGFAALNAVLETQGITIPYLGFFFITPHVPFFVAGMAIYFVRSEGHKLNYWLLFVASYPVAVYYILQDVQQKTLRYGTDFSEPVFLVMNSVFFFMFLLIGLNKTKFLQIPFFATLGAITYPLFLLHQNLGYMAFTYIPINKYVLLVLLLIVIFAAAYAVYRFVEKPFAKPFGAWLERRLPAKRKALS